MNVTDQIILDGITNIFSQCRSQINHEELRRLPIITSLLLEKLEMFEKNLNYIDLKEAYKEAYYFTNSMADECVTIINRHDCMCASSEVYHPEGLYDLVYDN